MIYLDSAATTPLLPDVRRAMEPYLDGEYGNASSSHGAGRRARRAIEDAREAVAAALGGRPREIVFTSGATESNHLALVGLAEASRSRGDHIVTTAVEHPSVLETCARLRSRGFRVTEVPVDPGARVRPSDVAGAVTPETILVSVMWVNNEVGTEQPIAELRSAIDRSVPLHADAAQALGKVAVQVRDVDLLSFSAHKMHGPKGVGGLWVRPGIALAPVILGGGQEFERRAGTENVAGIAGLARAIGLSCGNLGPNRRRMEALRERLREGLVALGGIRVNGDPEHRAPHILSLTLDGVESEALLLALDAEGICVSSGSACASLSLEPSHVLGAMGRSEEEARRSVRLSVSALTTELEIEETLRRVPAVLARLGRAATGPREARS
jgi:cysteine desulfurase